MKLKFYAYKDNRVGVFRNPVIYDKDEESFIDDLKTSFYREGITEKDAQLLAANDLYLLGEFDTKTGELTANLQFVCAVGPIAFAMVQKETVEEEGEK